MTMEAAASLFMAGNNTYLMQQSCRKEIKPNFISSSKEMNTAIGHNTANEIYQFRLEISAMISCYEK